MQKPINGTDIKPKWSTLTIGIYRNRKQANSSALN